MPYHIQSSISRSKDEEAYGTSKGRESALTKVMHFLYFCNMNICRHCKKEIPADLFIGRQEQCPFCRSDLHSCLNCVFYERGGYNDCREVQAERVLDKSRSNFCDFFHFRNESGKTKAVPFDPKDKLEALFKK